MSAAARMVGQSDWLPMMMPTLTLPMSLASCRLRAHYTHRAGRCNQTDDGRHRHARDPVNPALSRRLRTPARSRDDVGIEPVLDIGDPVLELQFLLLQPLDRKRIARAHGLQSAERLVEIAMLAAEFLQLDAQHLVRLHGQIAEGVHLRDSFQTPGP